MNPEDSLPPGWAWSSIGDYLLNHDSIRVPLKEADRAVRRGEYLYYGASGPIDTIDDYLFDGEYLLIAEDGANLLSRAKPIAFRAKGRFWVNNHAHVVTTDSSVPLGFVEHLLNSMDVSRYVTGSAQPKLPQGSMCRIRLPIAPVAEQRRIVDALDSYLTRLDAAAEGLKRVELNLKRYRASTLKAAVEGRLVPSEMELAKKESREYETGAAVLASILRERRRQWEGAELARLKAKGDRVDGDRWKTRYEEPSPPDLAGLPALPVGWCWATIDQIANVSGGVTKNAGRGGTSRSLPYLRVANVYANELRLTDIQEIAISDAEYERVLLRRGDVLVVEGNGSLEQIGRVAMWDGSISPCVHQNHIIKVRPVDADPILAANWILTWLMSPGGRNVITFAASSTSGLHTLSLSKICKMVIPFPPGDEQRRIIEAVESATSALDVVGDSATRSARRIGSLRQSILKWAFEGKLLDQDKNDEPASVLLDRIRAAFTARASQSKRPTRVPVRKTA